MKPKTTQTSCNGLRPENKSLATTIVQTSRSHLALLAASTSALVLATPSAHAAWSLIDTFDNYDNSATTRTSLATNRVWESVFDDGGTNVTGNANVIDTPDGGNLQHSTAGQTLQSVGGAAWRGNKSDIQTQFNAGLAVGGTGTYFFQMKAVGSGSFDIMTGLSAATSNIDTNNAFQDFAVMPFVAGTAGTTLSYRMTDAGLTGDVVFPMATDVWYNIWWVVDNTAEDYSVYWSTGTNDGTFGGTATQYRNGFTNTALNAMGFMAAGGNTSQLQVDNIYYTTGVDTTFVPEPSVAILGALGFLALLRRRR